MKKQLLGFGVVALAFWISSLITPLSAQDPAPAAPSAPAVEAPKAEAPKAETLTMTLDKTSLTNGGAILVSGKAPAGKPVFIEVAAEGEVRASRFDADPDKETGVRPYILYLTEKMPGFYKIFLPNDRAEKLEAFKKEKNKFSYSKALKELGADVAYSIPAKIKINRYQASLLGSIAGSRGDLLPAMDEKVNRSRSMQLVKARFRTAGAVFATGVDVKPDGSFTAKITIPQGSPPGKYLVSAVADKNLRSEKATVENAISFPVVYLENAGTSLNIFWPFLLTLAISVFGVLMGAGGGFILNPLLLSIWPLPHPVVAGTVMPTVLFSQGSGVYNYSKIKFINWKLGSTMGLAMVAGSFIGPKLTEMITLDQFKFVFGWILLVLAALMLWQTMPGYLEKNKKEQAILKEFRKRAEEAAKAKA
jgi:hypothetical protein